MPSHYDDTDKQFILLMTMKFIGNKKLLKHFETPDIYIIYWMDKMVTDGDMAYKTGERIFGKMFVTIDEILKDFGV